MVPGLCHDRSGPRRPGELGGEAAHQAHGSSAAVRRFKAIYGPELTGAPVVFTDYRQIATNR